MCGRFTLRVSPAELAEFFQLFREPPLQPRYNIAPTQPIAAVRSGDGGRVLSMLNWGLIPSWAKDRAMGSRMINARCESVATKPAFRGAFRRRRCLIPADGFYEWKKTGGRTKQPFYIHRRDGQPFAFAGLWEHWVGEADDVIESCTIITSEANEQLRDLHDRMPVILPEESYDQWLDSTQKDADALQDLLVPAPPGELSYYPIGTIVNNPRNDSPQCIEPQKTDGSLF